MNISRAALAALGGFITYFAIGALAFGPFSFLREEFARYPHVYRSQDAIQAVMPIGMLAMLVGIFAVTLVFSTSTLASRRVLGGIQFGVLIGLFVVCAFVLHNHVNLNVGWRLTVQQAIVYFLQWIVVCAVIGAIYRPRGPLITGS
jgi:hypothetical protein